MSDLRQKLAAIGLALALVASLGAVSAPMSAACARMQHTCCKGPGVAECCVAAPTPGTRSTPAEARFEPAPSLLAIAAPAPTDPVALFAMRSTAAHASPPHLSPPDFVTLYSSLLI